MTGEQKRQRNQRGDGARLKNELIEAAMRLLDAEPGVQLSLRAVAKESGVAPPSVYRHFPNAQTMMLEIGLQCWALLAEQMDKAAATSSQAFPFNVLKAKMSASIHYAMERPSRYQLLFDTSGAFEPVFEGPIRPAYRTVLESMEALAAQGKRLPANDAASSALLVISIAHGRIALAHLAPKLFVKQGAKVLLSARREELVIKAAEEAGEGAIATRCDVTNEDDVKAMVSRAMNEFGQIDILLNNAAAPGQDKWVWEQTVENFNSTLAIDLTASMLCSREVLNASMLERGSGSIVNFSSTAGWTGVVRKTHYTSAKAALRALTKTIALEVGPKGIRCNCLVPGSIETELWVNYGHRMANEQGISYDQWKEKALSSVPLRVISQPIDIANLALFLASDESRTITGQSINCDAGGYMVG